jgi:DNA-binding NtrC family response regulator
MEIQERPPDPHVRIVVIDDDEEILKLMTDVLSENEIDVVTESDSQKGLALALEPGVDIVVSDILMPSCSGLEILERIMKVNPTINVILLTGDYSTEAAVSAIGLGASDYINKTIAVSELRQRVGKFIAAARERRKAARISHEMLEVFQLEGIVGWGPMMLQVFDNIRRIAPHFRNLLIRGATGTGKELVARSLHALSPYSKGPFVACNCAAIVETLFESELFGHVRGAFTGAIQDRQGYFEQARNGTLFLDEIGDASLGMQAKLLRVLQDHKVQRVGSPKLYDVDVQVITATNRDLRRMVAEGQFREDLYYRIAPVQITLPRLFERREDLPLLQRHFVARFAKEYKKPINGISRKAQILLTRYQWPGNVRELENVIAHACMMAEGDAIEVQDLPEHIRGGSNASGDESDPMCSLELVQRRHIQRVLNFVGNSKIEAANILGISRTTLYRLLLEDKDKNKEALVSPNDGSDDGE